MSQSIASKLSAVVIAVVMNVIILGGVSYLFSSHSHAAPTSAHMQSDATHVPATIA